jgi:hypothetical protein
MRHLRLQRGHRADNCGRPRACAGGLGEGRRFLSLAVPATDGGGRLAGRVRGWPLSPSLHLCFCRIVRSQVRLQKLDFWLRNPDYLADELLNDYEKSFEAPLLDLPRTHRFGAAGHGHPAQPGYLVLRLTSHTSITAGLRHHARRITRPLTTLGIT